ncbi:hypothetical protein TW83_07820 [Paracoccus sp. S4493]|uniref:hypothetical protein n=1 Tax=Paracoccus sp. S4493 TaxID=579490 RepID=UPI0005F9E5E7|nr:hypothetical protein [Paracoccus sp. S4493]KJZ31565.1 hypothetical protein TW83_07820 [Paracoccus sp. S4493]
MANHCHNTTGLPVKSLRKIAGLPCGTRDRLALFAEWTGAPVFDPAQVVEKTEDGDTFSTEFLAYCCATGLSLDWVWLGDERSLVMGAFHAAQGGAA